MDAKTKELVGIAAAVAGHCQKCFSYHYSEAKRIDIDIKEINEAIEFAKSIRQAGDSGMDEFVERMLNQKTKL